MNSNFYKILHLADSAFPIGGFAYSNGMEFAVKSEIINSLEGLELYLLAYTQQLIQFELTFVKACYLCKSNEDLENIAVQYNAILLNPPLKKAGTTLGRNWLKALSNLEEMQTFVWPKNIDCDFPLVYGRTCCQLAFSLDDAINLFMFMAIRDQLSAVVRLGTLGPSQAQKLQYKMLNKINKDLLAKDIGDISQAYKTAYILELAQLSHKTLYTKLFQN